jgi:hypothetical protein
MASRCRSRNEAHGVLPWRSDGPILFLFLFLIRIPILIRILVMPCNPIGIR